jgi:uncharacterized membrane protein YfcA
MLLDTLFLIAAGTAAGLGGSVVGIASIFSYPALLLIGINPIDANVTNSVSLTFLSIGSIIGSKPEWSPYKGVLKKLAPATLIGGITGSILLLLTPSSAFEKIVPFLLMLASVAVLIPPKKRENTGKHVAVMFVLALAIGIYSGYFGAASGSLAIALLMQMLSLNIATAHALKNVLLGIANGIASILFIISGHVLWLPAIPLAIGFFIGGRVGPIIVRRANPTAIKAMVSSMGFAVALWLFLK